MKNLYIILISPLLLLACNESNTTQKEVASFKKESETWTDIIKIKKPVIQSYKIDNTNDTIIVGEKGTIFFIPKSAFKNVSISKNIEIQLSEFYSYMDFMSSNLTTTSNEQILETRGMVNFEAYQNGKSIVWDEKVPLKIYFPRMDTISNFITFSGYQDSLSNINWIPENAKNRSVRNNLDINYGLYNYTIGIGFLRDCKIEILDRTVKIGSFDIDYKLKNRDDDIFKYLALV